MRGIDRACPEAEERLSDRRVEPEGRPYRDGGVPCGRSVRAFLGESRAVLGEHLREGERRLRVVEVESARDLNDVMSVH
jgi:hypothetical protein